MSKLPLPIKQIQQHIMLIRGEKVMCAPSKALNLQSVRIRSTQRLTTSVEPTIALQEVTNVVKPMEGTY